VAKLLTLLHHSPFKKEGYTLRYRFVLYFALVVLLGGCTGMSMDSGGFRLGGGFHTDDHTDEAVETAYRDRISLVTINASLIVEPVSDPHLTLPTI